MVKIKLKILKECNINVNSIKCGLDFTTNRFNHENDDPWNETIESAGKIVRTYERGLITENETMKLLAELSY